MTASDIAACHVASVRCAWIRNHDQLAMFENLKPYGVPADMNLQATAGDLVDILGQSGKLGSGLIP
jgi:hypothetical protein